MNFIVLSKVGGILGPFAQVFGWIFNVLYNFLALFGIENVTLALILFTIIVKMLMLPLTIKQQRFTKLSAKMQPELAAIQAKYKGRKDEQSMRYQQEETQEVYAKYGTNPASGCLPLLIQLPIIFAVYQMIYAIPAYVTKIGAFYNTIAGQIVNQDGYLNVMTDFASKVGVATKGFTEIEASASLTINHVVDILNKFGEGNWNSLLESLPGLNTGVVQSAISGINKAFSLGPLNILNAPSHYGFFSIAIIVPILAVVTQLGTSLLQKAQQKSTSKKNDENQMAQSMNAMLYVMPFISGFFSYSFALFIGIYLIINTVVTMVQQIAINAYIEHSDMDSFIAKNVEKQKKRREKLGISSGSSMQNFAKTQTKSYNYNSEPRRTSTKDYANLSGSGQSKKKSVEFSDSQPVENVSDTLKKNTSGSKSLGEYANILKRD